MSKRNSMKNSIQLKRKGDHLLEIQGEIGWRYAQDPETGHLIAVCTPLNITLEADTIGELLPMMSDAMEDLFDSLVEDGTFEGFLKARNWALRPSVKGARHGQVAPPPLSLRPVLLHDLELAAC